MLAHVELAAVVLDQLLRMDDAATGDIRHGQQLGLDRSVEDNPEDLIHARAVDLIGEPRLEPWELDVCGRVRADRVKDPRRG